MTAERSDERIRYEISGSIACIGLARPPVNALDLPMVRGVIAALRRAAADDAVRAVVIASAVAKRFCAGLDIAELAGRAPDQIQILVHELYVGLFEAPISARQGFDRGGQWRRARRRYDARGLMRRCPCRRERHVRLSGDRSWRVAGYPFCASAADCRPSPRLRAALHRTFIRSRAGGG